MTKQKWMIYSYGYDMHYIKESMTWNEALITHIKWIYSSCPENKIKIYKTILNAFDNYKQAIEAFNIFLNDDKIIYMAPITDEYYIDEEAIY